MSLILGTLYALGLGTLTGGTVPGLTLFFVGLFVGIAAYNLHRVSPRLRAANLRLSAGLFTVFYAVLLLLVDIPPSGLFYRGEGLYVVVGAAIVVLAVRSLYRLEGSRPPRAEFAGASVFAAANVDGANLDDSPLVADTATAQEETGGGLLFETDSDAEGKTEGESE